MNVKSLKSINPFQSVIQTINDIVKAHGGEVEGGYHSRHGDGVYYSVASCLNHSCLP